MIEEPEEEKYMYQLVTPNKEHFDTLVRLKEKFPELTYNNRGYNEMPKEHQEKLKPQIQEISEILKTSLKGFSRFQNFKDRPDGSWCIRLQYLWSSSFKGVGYFDVRHWNPEEHGKY